MKREVVTCDICEREVPRRGLRGQLVYEVKVKWHWPGRRPEQWEPTDICEECWNDMVTAAHAAREERIGAAQ